MSYRILSDTWSLRLPNDCLKYKHNDEEKDRYCRSRDIRSCTDYTCCGVLNNRYCVYGNANGPIYRSDSDGHPIKISSWVYQKEHYSGPVTLSLAEWQQHLQNGDNVIQGAGGVIPAGTSQTAGGNSGAVYSGTVRQGYGGMGY